MLNDIMPHVLAGEPGSPQVPPVSDETIDGIGVATNDMPLLSAVVNLFAPQGWPIV